MSATVPPAAIVIKTPDAEPPSEKPEGGGQGADDNEPFGAGQQGSGDDTVPMGGESAPAAGSRVAVGAEQAHTAGP